MFPNQSEKNRAKQIEENYSLLRGDFGKVLRYFRTSKEMKTQIEVVQNVAGLVSRVFADLMFLNSPIITFQDPKAQAAADEFIFENQFFEMLYESALSQSYAGRASFKTYMEDSRVFVEELNPSTVFPQYNRMSTHRDPNETIISFEVEIAGQMYRYVERHVVGAIEYELWLIDGAGNTKGYGDISMLRPGGLPIESTMLDYVPIYHADNQKTGRDYFGFSDYDDLRSLFTELTRVQSQIATQLKKHADAKMAVPQGVLDEHGSVRNENIEMIEVSSTDETGGLVIPQYITNSNPLIASAFEEQNRLMEAIARTSEVSAALIDLNVSGGAERVGALKLRMLRTLAKVQRKLKPYERCVKQILIDAIAWQHGIKVGHNEVSIRFRNGLPEDMLEKTQIESTRIASGTQTVRDSVKNLDNIDGEMLDDKVAAIQEERAAEREALGARIPAIAF